MLLPVSQSIDKSISRSIKHNFFSGLSKHTMRSTNTQDIASHKTNWVAATTRSQNHNNDTA